MREALTQVEDFYCGRLSLVLKRNPARFILAMPILALTETESHTAQGESTLLLSEELLESFMA